jgi:hypothetical protein
LWSTINTEHEVDSLLDITADPAVLRSRFDQPLLTVDDTIPVSTFLEFW